MQYHCIHCDQRFELAAGEELRCPKCMRVHGLRERHPELVSVSPPKRKRRMLVAGGVLVVVLAAAGAGFAFWKRELSPDPVRLASEPLNARIVARELERRGVQAGAAARVLEVDPAVERFARPLASQAGEAEKLRALVDALHARAGKQAFVAWSLADPREGPSLTAGEVAAAIEKDAARRELYPLEVAALGVAALRAVDVPAMLVEVPGLPGERAPRDPSGRFGYFAVGLPSKVNGPPRVFDVYAQKPEPIACAECKTLGDLEAIGAALSLQATQKLAQNIDPALALRDADAAIKLWPSSATVRSARGAILLANAASELGQSEFEAALQMRPDGPRRNNVAMLALALGDSERATREVAQVLEQQPDYALAHLTLAQVHLATGERESARAELDKAEALDARSALVPLTRAQYHAMARENDQAIAQVKRALQLRPNDPQAHLLLGRIYRQAGMYEPMRVEAKAVMALVPAALAPRTREMLAQVLGPTALEPNDEPKADAPAGGGDPVELGAGKAASDVPNVHLIDPQSGAGPSAGTLNPSDGTPRLRLTDPNSGSGLRLKQP